MDALFSRFDLSDAADYAAFLTAHAAVVPSAEAAVQGLWTPFAPRASALQDDLADLGAAAPPSPLWPAMEAAECWGVLYVLEGSRLGGVFLARQVAAGRPRRYLDSRHAPGAWAAFQQALSQAVPQDQVAGAVDGAHRLFDAFEAAADAALKSADGLSRRFERADSVGAY